MKRMIAIALLLVMAMTLVACGGGTKEIDPATAIVGKWKNENGDVMEFTTNCGGTVVNGMMTLTCTWQYDAAKGNFMVDYTSGHDIATVTQLENGSLVLTWKGVEFKRIG